MSQFFSSKIVRRRNLVAAIAVFTAFLCMPFLHFVGWLGDEGIWLGGADRMLRGDVLYLDFFEFHPPGGFLLVEGWFRIAGESFLSARILAVITMTAIACLVYLCCFEASQDATISAAAAMVWVIASQGVWPLQVNHHLFTTLLSMIAAWAAFRNVRFGTTSHGMAILSGLAAGAAGMVTPTRGALAVLAVSTAFIGSTRQQTSLLIFVVGCTIVPIILCAYVLSEGSAVAAFTDVILWPATQYSSIQSVPFASGSWSSPFKYFHAINLILFLSVCILNWPLCLRDRVLQTSAALALAGVMGAYPRPDFPHIAFAAPLALPLTAYCSATLSGRFLQRRSIYLAAALFFFLVVLSIASFYRSSTYVLSVKSTLTARGVASFGEEGAAELIEQLAAEPSTERYFFYPYMPMLPYLTARRQVSKYEIFLPGYTTAEQYREACAQVMKDASLIVVNTKWTDHEFLRAAFPAMKETKVAEKEEFEKALYSQFVPIWQGGPFQILRRNNTTHERVCPGGE